MTYQIVPEQIGSTTFPHAATSARAARRWLATLLDPGPFREDIQLLVTELVGNSFRHGSGTIGLAVTMTPAVIRVEVTDDGSAKVPKVRQTESLSEGGYGLQLMTLLGATWGTDTATGRRRVWFEKALP